jgi:hypothetical protein
LSTGRPIGSSLNTLVNGRTPAPVNKKNLSLFNSKNKSNSPLLNTKSDIVQGHSLLVNKTTGNSRSISFFSNKLSKIRGAGHQGKYNIFRPSGRQKPGFIMQHSPSQDTSNNRLNYNLAAITPWPNFDPYISNLVNPSLVRPYNLVQGSASAQSKTLKDKKGKLARINDPTVSHLDWVVSIGANTSGSFTSPKQNANFYGTAPVDVFFGISVARQFNDHWGINPHVNLFSPQIINTAYAHINQSKVDSGQSLQISSSRKIYSINIPVCITYKPPGKFSFKAGPVFNIPVKQINTTSTLQPNIIRTDSAYYRKITGILNRTQYAQTFNYGISGGVSFKFKRLIFDATYSKSLNGYKVTSDFGTYKSYNGTLQLTIGFQLNKPKP